MIMALDGILPSSTERVSALEERVFNYAMLDDGTRIFVRQRTNEIKKLIRRTAQDCVDIGQKLIEVKQQLGHGNFEAWLRVEFDWGEWTARKFIQLAQKFKSVKFTDLSIATSALYLLASSSTPGDACQEILERASQGEVITYSKANSIVTRHKETATSNPVINEEEALVKCQSQSRNLSHTAAPINYIGDYPLEERSEMNTQLLSLIGNPIYLTCQEQQESKLLGQISEIKEVTATHVVIRIALPILSNSVIDGEIV
ncbi:MAG: DUF3102 domain-containing protein [Aphanocapsa sp. GSE-SYN-MK-11-07L]|jgi:hypothetical protein|nr:DUF3102 domain-containing protein [Aphanocapsa sp. GSE-SYN-MK-11-07L]